MHRPTSSLLKPCWDHLWLRQGYDVTVDPVVHDIMLVTGFVKALSLALRVRRKGLCWMALPCGSFSYMSSSAHRRDAFNPYGDMCREFVQVGNTICSRTCIVILVAICRSVCFFVEQPLRSAANFWPFIDYLMNKIWLQSHRTSW